MEHVLSQTAQRIIDAVIEAPVAWRTPHELAERLGWDRDQTLDAIADLDAAGWLEAWELVDGPVVTLSVAASGRCGVRLVEVGLDLTPRWARPGDPDPGPSRAAHVFRSERAARLDLVADPRPTAEEAAIRHEEATLAAALAATKADGVERFPRPTLLVGGGLTPWPGPEQFCGVVCPACGSARLPVAAYCLRCDRWGLDGELAAFLAATDRVTKARQAPRLPDPQAEARRRESERRRRRTKRRRRQALAVQSGVRTVRPDVPLWMAPVAG